MATSVRPSLRDEEHKLHSCDISLCCVMLVAHTARQDTHLCDTLMLHLNHIRINHKLTTPLLPLQPQKPEKAHKETHFNHPSCPKYYESTTFRLVRNVFASVL